MKDKITKSKDRRKRRKRSFILFGDFLISLAFLLLSFKETESIFFVALDFLKPKEKKKTKIIIKKQEYLAKQKRFI